MRNRGVLTVMILSFLSLAVAWADAPQLINFQGQLTDSLGAPVSNGSYSIRFRIYDDSLAGSVLWEETNPVQVSGGLFTVLLGSTSSIPESSFYATNSWLGIKVGTDTEIMPRQRLASVGYAFQSGQWTAVGNDLYRATGNVGIGTSNPTAKLDVGGVLLVDSSTSFVGVNRLAPVTGADYFSVEAPVGAGAYGGMYISTGSAEGLPFYGYRTPSKSVWTYLDGPSGEWRLHYNGDRIKVYSDGRVHIGPTPFQYGSQFVVIADSVNYSAAVSGLGSTNGFGVYGNSKGTGFGAAVRGDNLSGGTAGEFQGNVLITGTLTKGGGGFKIDHPLNPSSKYLYHSFVESPDMKNIYDGVISTDADGNAIVTLPDWFGALNRDFRYQLTVIGEFSQAIISKEFANNQFSISTDKPNVKVSWQVTGIRQDVYANAHRIPVEEEKLVKEKGYYLHPELFGQPYVKQIDWAHNPKMMQQIRDGLNQETK